MSTQRAQAVLLEAKPFLADLEARLAVAVARYPGTVEAVGRNAVAAGGKRLRPLLVYLTASDRERGTPRRRARSSSHTWRRSFTTT